MNELKPRFSFEFCPNLVKNSESSGLQPAL